MSEINENKAYYWLTLSGLSAKKLNGVLSAYSAVELWDRIKDGDKLRDFFGDRHYAELLRYRDLDYIDTNLAKIRDRGIRIVTLASELYPERLKQSEVSPPVALYYKGDLSCLFKPCITIVGMRECSKYGKEVAESFAREFAMAGVTVVSGMATGVDSYAHKAAVEFGQTAAVLGGGFDHIPSYSAKLAEEILYTGGAILSEYRPDFAPTKYTFPERNRIVSGLSAATVIVEAAERSGTLITADYALEQGRDVFAVPGNINSLKSVGTNAMIRDGHAKPVTAPSEVLSDLRLKSPSLNKKTSYISLDIYEEKIYNHLQSGTKSFDELLEFTGYKPGELTSLLFSLEMKNAIKRLSNNNYCMEGTHH